MKSGININNNSPTSTDTIQFAPISRIETPTNPLVFSSEGSKGDDSSVDFLFDRDMEIAPNSLSLIPPPQPWWKGCTNPWAQLIIYSLACFLTSCLYFGWQDYKRMLLRSQAYSWLCTGQEIGVEDSMEGACKQQIDAVDRLYAYANGSEFAFAALAGLALDSIGPRYTAVIGEAIHLISTILLIFSSEKAQFYVPALFLAGVCVNLISFPALSIKQNWASRQALCVAIIVGCQSSASLVPPLLRVFWDNNPQWTFRGIWGVWLAVAWLPISCSYIWALPAPQAVKLKSMIGSKASWKAFWRDARTLDLVLMGIYCTLQMFQFAYFPAVSSEAFGESVSAFQGWVTPIQGPGSILIGYFMDYTGTILVMYVMCFTLLITNLASAVGARSRQLMMGASFWFIFVQSATYNLKYTFVNEMFDPPNFGKLVGCLGLFSGGGVYLSAALMSTTNYKIVFGCLAALAVVMLALTTILFWRQIAGVCYKTTQGAPMDAHRFAFLKRREQPPPSEPSLPTTVGTSPNMTKDSEAEEGAPKSRPRKRAG